MSERVVVGGGLLWYSLGGWWAGWSNSARLLGNHSEIVSFNPRTSERCVYVAPDDDNEIFGLAYRDGRVWFVEERGERGRPSLDTFTPSRSCESGVIRLPVSIRRAWWPKGASGPAQIAFDPSGTTLWVTDLLGSAIDRIDVRTLRRRVYRLPADRATPRGAEPWQLLVTNRFVYATEYGNAALIRINVATGQIDERQVPIPSDQSEVYGLALRGDRLYFTISDDVPPMGATAIGYLSTTDWSGTGTVYTGLSADDLRGIASNSRGELGVADLHAVLTLRGRP